MAGKSDKGVDFGRGTKNIPGEDYTKIQEGTAPNVAKDDGGTPRITDKTSG